MPMNTGLKAKYQKQKAEAVYAARIRSMCQPKERAGLYNVVSKFDGAIIARSVPLEYTTSFGSAAFGYTLVPVD